MSASGDGFKEYLNRVLRPTAARLVAQEYRERGDIVERLVEFDPLEAAGRAGLAVAELLIGLADLVSEGIVEASFVEPTLGDLRAVGAALAKLDLEFLFGRLSGSEYRRLVHAVWSLVEPGAPGRLPLCERDGGEPPAGALAAHLTVFRAATLARMLASQACSRLRRVREALGSLAADPVLREALAEELKGLAAKLELVAKARCGVIEAAEALPPERLGAAAEEAGRLSSLLNALREAAEAAKGAVQGLGSGTGIEALDRAIGLLCGGIQGA